MKKTLLKISPIALLIFTLTLATNLNAMAQPKGTNSTANNFRLTREQASRFARLALKCVAKEYPNKLDHVMNDGSEVQNPRALHPAFYGCFDWHSSVHGHWMLVRLLRTFADLPEAAEIRKALDENLTAKNILVETDYLSQANRQSFERTYGWAWLLKLAEELQGWEDADGKKWSSNLQPLAEALAARYVAFLPKQTYPIRTGVHPNTAFGLAFALDYADAAGKRQLAGLIRERSLTYFSADAAYPANWEPGGEDFFSPALMEADLMRRVMKPAQFARWFHRFLPGIAEGKYKTLLEPATVSDRSDPKIVHLDGLNLSRAWCMRAVASALPRQDGVRASLARAATLHAKVALENVASGDYAGEHWLASFAVYMLSVPAPE
jgi:hypothetical protein